MMDKSLTIDRGILPSTVLEWLEADQQTDGFIHFRKENEKIILEHLDNVDPAMMVRVRANIEKYRSVLQRLADS
ncbi:MAG: hypothetical protein HY257_07730 [Chloroflexi bacterium]|nr:hypothetical protein [Chloroflexota bacterium]